MLRAKEVRTSRKNIHLAKNWKPMDIREGRESPRAHLMFAGAPSMQDGELYPPISWTDICEGYRGALTFGQMQCGLPQVWTRHEEDHARVLGTVWEICARWEMGEFELVQDTPSGERVKNLVCAVHQHLGDQYAQFCIS